MNCFTGVHSRWPWCKEWRNFFDHRSICWLTFSYLLFMSQSILEFMDLGGFDRWRLWAFWALEVMILEVMNVANNQVWRSQPPKFWSLWAWRLWTSTIPQFLEVRTFLALEVMKVVFNLDWRSYVLFCFEVLEVMNFGGCEFGGYERSLYPVFRRLWTLKVTVLEVMILGGCGLGRFNMAPQRLPFFG